MVEEQEKQIVESCPICSGGLEEDLESEMGYFCGTCGYPYNDAGR